MSIKCYTGASLLAMAPDFEPPPGPPVKRLESALLVKGVAQRRCRACARWTNNLGRVCTRCLRAGRGRG